MHNRNRVSDQAADILEKMIVCAERLPENWESAGYWPGAAQFLAQFTADYGLRFDRSEIGALLAIGGQMIIMADREREANPEAVVGDWIAAFGKGGVA
jgi:hypothetical protein